MRHMLTVILILVFVCPVSAWGQDRSKYYTNMHPDEFTIDWIAFYKQADESTAEVRREYPSHLGLPYGTHAKQKLDLYLPKGSVRDAPVFLFLHGGGFREGDRAHYGFVARPLADNGIITAVASYRLTTQDFHYPDQPDDVKNMIAWLYRNIRRFGGDPQRISIGGHSAGAILSATVCLRSDWQGEKKIPLDVVKGCVPISGPYDLRIGGRKGESDAYANKPEFRPEASPIINVQRPPGHTIIAVGGVEQKYIPSSREMVSAIQNKGGSAELIVLEGMDHDRTAQILGDESSVLTQAILRMIRGGTEE